MRTAIIIPARFASSRLPGKPLLAETGKTLIQHTYEKAAATSAAEVYVATDDLRIVEAVEGFGGKALMTSAEHESGTARIAEAAEGLDADIIVNLQGDEPETDPEHIDALISLHAAAMASSHPVFASTLACPFASSPITGPGAPDDPSCVKVVIANTPGEFSRALYFSRALVPYPRDEAGRVKDASDYHLHIGVYAFSAASLQAFCDLPPSSLEETEKLEQLRILEAGHAIAVQVVPSSAPGIDTPEDYVAFVNRYRGSA